MPGCGFAHIARGQDRQSRFGLDRPEIRSETAITHNEVRNVQCVGGESLSTEETE